MPMLNQSGLGCVVSSSPSHHKGLIDIPRSRYERVKIGEGGVPPLAPGGIIVAYEAAGALSVEGENGATMLRREIWSPAWGEGTSGDPV